MVSGGIKGAHPLLLGKQSEEPSLSGTQTAAGHAPAEALAPLKIHAYLLDGQPRPRLGALRCAHGCPVKLRGTQLKSWVDSDGFSLSLQNVGGTGAEALRIDAFEQG